MTTPTPYVSKSDLQLLLTEWVTARDQAVTSGTAIQPVPNAIGQSIMDICTRMGRRPNFNGYTFIDEMISDGVVDCVRAVKNYSVDHCKQNPFGYFSRIVWNAFLRRIEVEGKLVKLKQELMYDENHIAYSVQEGDEGMLDKNDFRQNFGDDH